MSQVQKKELIQEPPAFLQQGNALLQKIAKACDYFFLLRPTLFFPVWTIYTAGYFTGQHFFGDMAIMDRSLGKFWPVAIGAALTLLMGSVFIINQLIDAAIDRKNNKLFLIANGHISEKHAKIEAGLLAGIGLLTGFIHSVQTGVIFAAIFLITGVFYSMRPFKWKDRALRGLLLNALGALMIFCAGWQSGTVLIADVWVYAIPYIAAVSGVYIYTTLLDIKGDSLYGKTTFAVDYGETITIYVGAALGVFALVSAWLLLDPLIFYPALFAAPLFLITSFRQTQRNADRAIKYPILFLALAISYKLPPFFVVIFVTYYFSKFYYFYRFGMRYPRFETEQDEKAG
ncbi:MAG: UbiA family prenyltransferase [bacterium]